MQISETYVTIINVTFILLLIGFGAYGYFRGLFKQGIDIVSMLIIAWLSTLLAPLLAKNIELVPNLSVSDVSVISTIVRRIVNSTLWTIVLFVVFMILVGIVRMVALRHIQKPWNHACVSIVFACFYKRQGYRIVYCIIPAGTNR
jgi:hypothetical protein